MPDADPPDSLLTPPPGRQPEEGMGGIDVGNGVAFLFALLYCRRGKEKRREATTASNYTASVLITWMSPFIFLTQAFILPKNVNIILFGCCLFYHWGCLWVMTCIFTIHTLTFKYTTSGETSWQNISRVATHLRKRGGDTKKIFGFVRYISYYIRWKLIYFDVANVRRLLTITNWRLLWSLHMKPPRILYGHSKKREIQ